MVETVEALSANEAASVTGVPLKQVHRIVDAGLLEGAVATRSGKRLILGRGLVGLKLAHETADLLSHEGRRRLVRRAIEEPLAKSLSERSMSLDLRPAERAVRRGLSRLEKARSMVAIDEDVLGGRPCFRGTRIPVHDIAAMLANGDEHSDILDAYPQLSAEQIDIAVVYAQAYPRRGRPRHRPRWRQSGPVSSESLAADDLPRAS